MEQVREHACAQRRDQVRDFSRFEQVVALLVNHFALVIGDVVILEQLLAHVEVARLDLALRRLDRARDDAGFDRLAFRHFQAVHDRAHAVAGENAQ